MKPDYLVIESRLLTISGTETAVFEVLSEPP
jgi:hypothetical protein